jgi:hypothetical protein
MTLYQAHMVHHQCRDVNQTEGRARRMSTAPGVIRPRRRRPSGLTRVNVYLFVCLLIDWSGSGNSVTPGKSVLFVNRGTPEQPPDAM